MRILIDTNILIPLEDFKEVPEDNSKLYRIATENHCDLYYHPDCLKDIAKDKDLNRRRVFESKLTKYQKLPNPAPLTPGFEQLVGVSSSNDRIDVVQLYQAYLGYVELFITNDKKLLKKADGCELNKVVMDLTSALIYLGSLYTLRIPEHPSLAHGSVRDLIPETKSPFFESLKNDYGPKEFIEWLTKCARENRQCYTFRQDNELSAILIYNLESAADHQIPNVSTDALKICTMKVGNNALGLKLGELFLNKMPQLCLKQNYQWLYLTTYDRQVSLIKLLELVGFEKKNEFTNKVGKREFLFCKNLNRNEQNGKDSTQLHPYFRESKEKYIIPIQEKFYRTLFKDGLLRPPELFDGVEFYENEIHGNTIVKAYISNSNNMKPKTGDMLFFYSSKHLQCIEPVGIVIEHQKVRDLETLWRLVRNKTVYPYQDLEKMIEEKGTVTVTIFRLVQYLQKPILFRDIQKLASFANKFQTITRLQPSDYLQLKTHHLDERYIVD